MNFRGFHWIHCICKNTRPFDLNIRAWSISFWCYLHKLNLLIFSYLFYLFYIAKLTVEFLYKTGK